MPFNSGFTALGPIANADGSATAPGSAFSSEVSLGWYRSAASSVALSYGSLTIPSDISSGGNIRLKGNGNALVALGDYGIRSGTGSPAALESVDFPVTSYRPFRASELYAANAGTAILPAYSMSEASLGWYRSAASVMALSYGGLNMPRGTNASFGTALLSVGSVKVSTTYIATGDIVMLASQGGGTLGNLGALEVNGITSGTSFNINSTSATDNNVVAWWIIKSH